MLQSPSDQLQYTVLHSSVLEVIKLIFNEGTVYIIFFFGICTICATINLLKK